jgi:hypothetical protein
MTLDLSATDALEAYGMLYATYINSNGVDKAYYSNLVNNIRDQIAVYASHGAEHIKYCSEVNDAVRNIL